MATPKCCLDNGHQYEARYEDKAYGLENEIPWVFRKQAAEILRALKENIYIFDICTKCGDKVLRK